MFMVTKEQLEERGATIRRFTAGVPTIEAHAGTNCRRAGIWWCWDCGREDVFRLKVLVPTCVECGGTRWIS